MPPTKSGDALSDDVDNRDDLPPSGEEGAVKWKKKRRTRGKRKREDRDRHPPPQSSRDPLEVFGADLMVMILKNVDARSVALSLLVSRAWYRVASSDRLWSLKLVHVQCEELWCGKAHIPRISQVHGLSKLSAYSSSLMDGKRIRITKYDLCDHAWDFHFGKAAPEYWQNLDPYWIGTSPPMRRYFHLDGSQSADPGDMVWGGHECCYSIVTSFVGDGKIREHYVRINRWPRMSVFRKQDWSWEMSNDVFFYSSVPDANKIGGTGPLFPVVCGL